MESRLGRARARIAVRTGTERLGPYLAQRYGVDVTGLTELDLGVYRVAGAGWVARLFPAARRRAGRSTTRCAAPSTRSTTATACRAR